MRSSDQDRTGDGKLSREEAPEHLQQGFDKLDGNQDGFIDEQELRQHVEGAAPKPQSDQPEPKVEAPQAEPKPEAAPAEEPKPEAEPEPEADAT